MSTTELPNGMIIHQINQYETNFLFEEIFVHRVYARGGVRIDPGAVVIDAGANIGMFAIYVLSEFNPGRVLCFEPAPHCLERLRANLAPWADRVAIHDVALADGEREADFTYYPGNSIMSGLFADKDRDLRTMRSQVRTMFAGRAKRGMDDRMVDTVVGTKLEEAVSFRCRVTTISDVICANDLSRVDLLKIDVEYAEGLILRGIADEHWDRIRQIVVEVHDQGAAEHEAMREMLVLRGYDVSMAVDKGMENSGIYSLAARRL